MLQVYISVLNDYIEVSEEGRFELPSREYSSTDLRKIAREVNKAMRIADLDD